MRMTAFTEDVGGSGDVGGSIFGPLVGIALVHIPVAWIWGRCVLAQVAPLPAVAEPITVVILAADEDLYQIGVLPRHALGDVLEKRVVVKLVERGYECCPVEILVATERVLGSFRRDLESKPATLDKISVHFGDTPSLVFACRERQNDVTDYTHARASTISGLGVPLYRRHFGRGLISRSFPQFAHSPPAT
jgi:hypothetical protein